VETSGAGIRSGNESFFLCLVASLFADSERALLLTGYGTLWVPFEILLSSFFRVVSHHWDIGISIICHFALPPFYS
jgi:hypothetical protein